MSRSASTFTPPPRVHNRIYASQPTRCGAGKRNRLGRRGSREGVRATTPVQLSHCLTGSLIRIDNGAAYFTLHQGSFRAALRTQTENVRHRASNTTSGRFYTIGLHLHAHGVLLNDQLVSAGSAAAAISSASRTRSCSTRFSTRSSTNTATRISTDSIALSTVQTQRPSQATERMSPM